jgi:CBS domain-containing protein
MAKVNEASVADLMTTGVITCAPDTDLGSVAATLSRAGVHAIFVREKGRAPSGVVTDFDLLAGEWLADDAESLNVMRTMTAGELMTSPVETIGSRALASEAAARLRQLHLSRLLVTNEWGSAVGVITVSDLIAPLDRTSVERRCVQDVMSRAIVICSAADAG